MLFLSSCHNTHTARAATRIALSNINISRLCSFCLMPRNGCGFKILLEPIICENKPLIKSSSIRRKTNFDCVWLINFNFTFFSCFGCGEEKLFSNNKSNTELGREIESWIANIQFDYCAPLTILFEISKLWDCGTRLECLFVKLNFGWRMDFGYLSCCR